MNGTIIETEDFIVNHLKESDDLTKYRCQADNVELRHGEERPTADLTLRVSCKYTGWNRNNFPATGHAPVIQS